MSTPFYDLASLVVVPSGYKSGKVYAQKPLTTDGQLTFTRASSATRVGPNGLIEKVRTNLVPDGLLFNTSTGVLYTTVTSDSPISGVSSTRITKNEAAGTLRYGQQVCSTPSIASNTIHTISRFFKYDGFNTTTSLEFNNGGQWGVSWRQDIDIASTGVTLQAPSSCTSKITNVGSGWYRVDVTIATGTVTVGGPATYLLKVASALSTGQGFLTAAPQLETGDIATDYIPTTTAAVSVGPVSGLPRLDYLNSTCGKLILEPQRTNAAQYSEQLNNAAWTKNGVSVTANSAVSPDGYTNADKIVETATTGPHGLTPTYPIANSTTYTFSIFAKKAENDYFIMNIYTGVSSTFTSFNVANGTIGTTGAGATAKIENYANGWYRCSLTVATAATGTPNIFMWTARANDAIEYTGNGTNGTFLYGCQLEAGAYATSYIPTLGASVTRVADAASKTGISSLIGQTEGTALLDFQFNGTQECILMDIAATGLSPQNRIILYNIGNNTINLVIFTANAQQASILSSAYAVGQRIKVGVGYKVNDFVLYINGVQIGTDNSGTVPATSRVDIGNRQDAGFPAPISVNQTLLFTTRLTNAQLAELTAL